VTFRPDEMRGFHGRWSTAKSLGGDRHEIPKVGLGRPTRTARLKSAATRHHNAKVSAKVVNKGTVSTPVEAGQKKARRIMGTQPPRPDYTRDVLSEQHQKQWVRLNWSKVPSRRSVRGEPLGYSVRKR
jgi:hypothetical protein